MEERSDAHANATTAGERGGRNRGRRCGFAAQNAPLALFPAVKVNSAFCGTQQGLTTPPLCAPPVF